MLKRKLKWDTRHAIAVVFSHNMFRKVFLKGEPLSRDIWGQICGKNVSGKETIKCRVFLAGEDLTCLNSLKRRMSI